MERSLKSQTRLESVTFLTLSKVGRSGLSGARRQLSKWRHLNVHARREGNPRYTSSRSSYQRFSLSQLFKQFFLFSGSWVLTSLVGFLVIYFFLHAAAILHRKKNELQQLMKGPNKLMLTYQATVTRSRQSRSIGFITIPY